MFIVQSDRRIITCHHPCRRRGGSEIHCLRAASSACADEAGYARWVGT
jgi:hypothetical protein